MLVNITPNLTVSFWNDLVKPFEQAHPGLTVKILSPSSASVDTTITTDLAAGTVPDVAEGANIQPISGQLLDLSDQSWATSAPLASKLAIDGKTYAVPIGVQLQSLMFYNKDDFTKAGISAPPTTMDELTADMAKLKSAGITPVQTAGDTWVTGAQISMIAAPTLFADDPNWYVDVNSGKTSLANTIKPVLSLYDSWLSAGYLPKDALGVKYTDGQTDFLAGKAAMYPMGSWFVAAATAPFPIGVFAIPAISGSGPAAMGGAPDADYAIFKSTSHQAAALALVQYLTNDKTAVVAQLKGDGTFRAGYPYHINATGDEVQSILDSVGTNVVPIGAGYGPTQMPAGYDAEFNKETQGLYVGQSVSSVVSGLTSWVAAQPK
jgi:multiple sugar transport system substrate-binding protein/raffinose/stachyose/melibiose transport system substrate-binding protein